MSNKQGTIPILVVASILVLAVGVLIFSTSAGLRTATKVAQATAIEKNTTLVTTTIVSTDEPLDVAIRKHFEGLGVPVSSVRLKPATRGVTVTLTLQTESKLSAKPADMSLSTFLGFEDGWHIFLTERELSLFYLKGNSQHIDGYEILLVDASNTTASYELGNFMPEEFSQQLQPVPQTPAKLNDAETQAMLANKLRSDSVELKSINVTTGKIVRPGTKFVEMSYIASSEQDPKIEMIACKFWLGGSTDALLDDQTGANISLLRLDIFDVSDKQIRSVYRDTDRHVYAYNAGPDPANYKLSCFGGPKSIEPPRPLDSPLPSPTKP